ncbi:MULTISPECIES: esterase/lipase family protein [unclassified Nocardioides]|uniref:esterase/lipase family protein n=1 Tax=unclassified Nocardioides TaxID=2615069 RepID=UPI0006F970B4|nr:MULTISPECIES: triacylglycerol lipase [unclassified Nocardioides]KQY55526.1 lipase [Nocardioides sp. Root140]KRF12738.1 lipase [Nocardioides sp. Soil796]
MRRIALAVIATLALFLTVLGPTASQAAPRSTATAAGHDPVIFVHGWSGASWNWDYYVGRFEADGWSADELYAWDYDFTQSNVTTAGQLRAYVDEVLARTGASKVDIVTHSMGGLSSRYYLKNLGGTAKVDDWVSIGGPNHGTNFAWGCWTTSCGDMRPGSTFLTALNSGDETPGSMNYRTFWSPCDEIINPDTSVILSGATNTQTGCVGHLGLLADGSTYTGVANAVR